MGFLFSLKSVQLRHGLAPETVAKSVDDLLHFPKRTLDLEAIAVQADDVDGVQAQIGTDQNGAPPLMNDKHKAQFLVQALAPEQIQTEKLHRLFFTIQRKGGSARRKQLFEFNRLPFFGWTASSRPFSRGTFVSETFDFALVTRCIRVGEVRWQAFNRSKAGTDKKYRSRSSSA